jgi:L-alanine-DL-glutamate epimerase-like enolase superfamily enzyme
MKIGRGARHMPTDKGLSRDIAVVNAVRETIGGDGKLLVDVNNGYTLNLAKTFLTETKSSNLFFIEEPFHEDPPVSRALKDWMKDEGMKTLLADGEGDAAPHLIRWAIDGAFDVLQYDIFIPGFTRWLEIADEIRPVGVKIAPHHYGAILGNYVTPHLSPLSKDFLFVEWDEAQIDGLDASAFGVTDGFVEVSNRPGFGLKLDEDYFAKRVSDTGWSVS